MECKKFDIDACMEEDFPDFGSMLICKHCMYKHNDYSVVDIIQFYTNILNIYIYI